MGKRFRYAGSNCPKGNDLRDRSWVKAQGGKSDKRKPGAQGGGDITGNGRDLEGVQPKSRIDSVPDRAARNHADPDCISKRIAQ